MNILESYVNTIIIIKIRNVLHPSVGDVVIIHEDVLKRCDWRIGKIVELIKSKDGKIRSAKVDVISKNKIMTSKRPINKLFSAEFSNQKNIELNFVNEKNIPQIGVGGSVA